MFSISIASFNDDDDDDDNDDDDDEEDDICSCYTYPVNDHH